MYQVHNAYNNILQVTPKRIRTVVVIIIITEIIDDLYLNSSIFVIHDYKNQVGIS